MPTSGKYVLAAARDICMERDVKLSTLHHVAIWLGAATSVITLCIVIWKGGMLNERVDTDSKRIDRLEQQGSAGLQAHEGLDDQRIADIKERLAKAETGLLVMGQIRADVAEIKTSVEFLTGKRNIPKSN